MINLQELNRWQAFAIHLGISLIIFLALLAIIIFIWYPGFLIEAGGWQGIKIVAGVDLILGPVLTALVFNNAKPLAELRRDLSIIAVIQISCLSAGVWLVYQERPLLQVLTDEGVFVYSRADLEGFKIRSPDIENFQKKAPYQAVLSLPDNLQDIKEVKISQAIAGKVPLNLRTDLYIDMQSAEGKQYLKRYLSNFELTNNSCRVMPFYSKHIQTNACYDIRLKKLRAID